MFLSSFFIHSRINRFSPLMYRLNSPSFFLEADLKINPFFFEHDHQMQNTGFFISISPALKFPSFVIGPEAQLSYFSFDGKKEGDILHGTLFSIRGLITSTLFILDWFHLQFGFGGMWLQSNFESDAKGWIALRKAGLVYIFNIIFNLPFEFINFEIRNQIDIVDLFNFEKTTFRILPFYTGSFRVNFIPYLRWIKIFLESSAMVYQYQDEEIDITKGMFLWSIGVSFDLTFPEESSYMSDVKQKWIEKRQKETVQEEKIEIDPIIAKLLELDVDETVSYYTILFIENSNILEPDSYGILDKIYHFLEEYRDRNYLITGYSEYLGIPALEIQQSTEKAKAIKNYLVNRGIDEERLTITTMGTIYFKEDNQNKPEIKFTRTK